jgi:hypothetical protein
MKKKDSPQNTQKNTERNQKKFPCPSVCSVGNKKKEV